MATASCSSYVSTSSESTNFTRLGLVSQNELPNIFRKLLLIKEPLHLLESHLSYHTYLSKHLNAHEWNVIKTVKTNQYLDFDISLMYKLIRNLNLVPKPTQGWDNKIPPSSAEITEGDDVERIRRMRNEIVHSGKTYVTDAELADQFSILKDIANRLEISLKISNREFVSKIENAETCCIDTDLEQRYISRLRELSEKEKQSAITVTEVHKGLTNITVQLSKLEKEIHKHREQVEGIPKNALPRVSVETRRIEVLNYGSQVTLKCKITSKSSLESITWYKGEHHIHSDTFEKDHEMDDQTHILTLNDIKDSDLGEYKCEVHNAKGSIISEPIHVVYALPVVTVESRKIEVLKYGTQVTLKCKISSESNIKSVKWFKDEQHIPSEIFETHKETDDSPHILSFKEIKESNISLPVVTVEGRKIEVLKSGTQYKRKRKVTPKSNNKRVKIIQSIHSNSFRKKQEIDDTIHKLTYVTLNNIKECDIGEYKCEVHNAKGSNTSEPIHVVYALPVVTVESKKIEVMKYGTQIKLKCKVTSESNLKSVKWFRGEHHIHSESLEKDQEIDDPTHTLTLNDVKESDIGEYKCEVHNAKGSNTSELINVVYALPVITVKLNKIEIPAFGRKISVSCDIFSDSKVSSVVWYKGKHKIDCAISKKYEVVTSTNDKASILTINDLQESDIAVYSCVIQNKMGMNESESIQVMYDSKGRKTYMDAIASGTEVRRYVRIQVIGKHRVGKSSLVRRLLGENIKGVKSTDGIDVVKRCLINTKNNEWIVDTDETERTEQIRRILRAKRKNKNRGEPVSDEIHPSKERKVVTERTPAEPDIFSSELEKIEEESNVSKSITISETEYRDSISVSLNDNSSATDTMNQDKDILNTAKLLGNAFVLSRDTCDNQKPKLSLDNMTKRFISEMDEILFDVKRNQDKMASEGLVECGLWDFAGQKDYYVTHQTFLNPHSIYLLVADISEDIKPINDDADFDSIGEYIDFWFDSIHCLRTDSPVERLCPHVIVVCTYIDKYKSDEQLKQRKNEYENEFNMIMGRQLKSNHKRGIYYISNEISSDRDFDELKIRISKLAEEMQYFYEELPTEWIKLENALSVLKDLKTNQSNILSWQEIEELAQKTFLKREDLLSFLLYQHKIGNILFFQNISDYIIIQPNWLIKCFRCLVCDDHTEKRNVNVVASTDWHNLINTGVLSDNIIDMLFEKEPDLEFGKYKTHLLDVMEKFDIIVKPQVQTTNNGKCKTSNSYYMPCMIRKEPISLKTIQEKWTAGTNNFSKSPWLITEFEFLPLAYFNHILFFYIRQYTVIEDEEGQKSIYKGKALVNLDDTGRRKLVVCFSKNAISLQIWKSTKVDVEIYKQIKKQLCDNIEKLKTKLSMKISYDIKAKCSSGENSKKQGRISFQDLDKICEGGYYFCDEHKEDHDMAEIENTWFHYVDSIETKRHKQEEKKKGKEEETSHKENQIPKNITVEKPLSKEQRTKIIRNYTTIIGSIGSIKLECLLEHMVLTDVFSLNDIENINSKGVQKDRNRAFLFILLRGSQKGYTEFIHCLQEDDTYRDIANEIEKTVVKQVENGTPVEKPLSKEQQTKITRNYTTIINSLTDNILDQMLLEEVFSLNEVEHINSKVTQKDRNRAFISILLKGSQNGYTEFIRSLHEDEVYSDIANEIEKTVVKQLEDGTPVTRPMTKEHQAKILRNSNTIIDFVMIEDILDYMITSEVFSINDADQIRSQATHKRKNSKFIDILIRSNLEGYSEFIECLRTHHKDYNYIADQIEYSSVEDEEDKTLVEKPLSKEQRTKIIRNYTTIIGSIGSIECLVDHMVCEDVFSYDDMENINSKGFQKDKNRAFLSILLTGSQKGYTEFIRYLQEDDTYRDIANKIEKTVVKQVENGTPVEKPLSKEQQTKITRNYTTIINSLTDNILDQMLLEEVFSLNEVEHINSKVTQKDRNRAFISILLKGSQNGYTEFIRSLHEDEVYSDIANEIEKTVVKQLEDGTPGIMTKEQELKIKKNHDAIIEELRFDDVVDDMITTETLSLDDVERINSKHTTKDKNREFVRILIKGKRGYEEFIRCLFENYPYLELAKRIQTTVVAVVKD